MKTLKTRFLVFSLSLLTSLSTACTNAEDQAASLYETAQFEEEQRNIPHAKKLYQEIIRDRPETSFAAKALARLNALEQHSD